MEGEISEEELKSYFKQITETEEINSLLIDGENSKLTPNPEIHKPIFLCGSYNPLHEGHMKLLESGYSHFPDCSPYYHFCTTNCDKGSVDFEVFLKRVAQFIKLQKKLIVCKSPLFIQYARIWSSCVFILGYDTFTRLLLPKYYDNNPDNVLKVLEEFRQCKSHFLVAGRYDQNLGQFLVPDLDKELEYPEYKDLFSVLTEDEFRIDLSSTELRNSGHTL